MKYKMFKRSLILTLSIISSLHLMAQNFSFSNSKNGFNYNSKGESLILVDSNDASIVFTSPNTPISNCKWYKIQFNFYVEPLKIDTFVIDKSNFTVSSDSQSVTLKNIDANIGYLIEYGDNSCDIDKPCHAFTWITKYLPIDTITWNTDTVICQELELSISPVMSYFTEYGSEKKINRTLQVDFLSLLQDGEGTKVDHVKNEYTGNKSIVLDDMPYVNTPFTIEDITNTAISQKIVTDTFYTQAVVAYPYIITTNAQEHEGDEGSDTLIHFSNNIKEAIQNATKFRSSGPLTFNLISNANEMTNHYEWAIAKGTDAKQGDFSNAFVLFNKDINSRVESDPNLYCIELTVSNIRNDSICQHQSYTCFNIAESQLKIPNAFTPNGDGTNDEFRVAYRSISEFHCSIYDQWGHCVYESSDITQGWDGYIGSKLGAIGTYFYVIEAIGTDDVEYKEKGTVNLLRSK